MDDVQCPPTSWKAFFGLFRECVCAIWFQDTLKIPRDIWDDDEQKKPICWTAQVFQPFSPCPDVFRVFGEFRGRGFFLLPLDGSAG
jgi:hypothetical protein